MKNSQVLTSEDPKTNSQVLILEDLKANLITAIDNFDIFKRGRAYCIFDRFSYKKLKDILSFWYPKDFINIETNDFDELKQKAKDSVLNELLAIISLEDILQEIKTGYKITTNDDIISIKNVNNETICSIEFKQGYLTRTLKDSEMIVFKDGSPSIISFNKDDRISINGNKLCYNNCVHSEFEDEYEMQHFTYQQNHYTLSDLYYYMNTLNNLINSKINEEPSHQDIIFAMWCAENAVLNKSIKKRTEQNNDRNVETEKDKQAINNKEGQYKNNKNDDPKTENKLPQYHLCGNICYNSYIGYDENDKWHCF